MNIVYAGGPDVTSNDIISALMWQPMLQKELFSYKVNIYSK